MTISFADVTRKKLRFETSKGVISTEDLWDLPLTSETFKVNLDDIARGLFRKLKESEEISFVKKDKKKDDSISELQLKLDVVKAVIDTISLEREEASKAREKSEKRQQIMALIQQKENEKLTGLNIEDLRAQLESL